MRSVEAVRAQGPCRTMGCVRSFPALSSVGPGKATGALRAVGPL